MFLALIPLLYPDHPSSFALVPLFYPGHLSSFDLLSHVDETIRSSSKFSQLSYLEPLILYQ